MDLFANLNNYRTIEQLTFSTAEELTKAIKEISRPIKIINIVATNTRYTVFFLTDVPIKKKQKNKRKPTMI